MFAQPSFVSLLYILFRDQAEKEKSIKMSPTADQVGGHHCTECKHCTHSWAVIGWRVEWESAALTTSREEDKTGTPPIR